MLSCFADADVSSALAVHLVRTFFVLNSLVCFRRYFDRNGAALVSCLCEGFGIVAFRVDFDCVFDR